MNQVLASVSLPTAQPAPAATPARGLSKGLGRGLGALLDDTAAAAIAPAPTPGQPATKPEATLPISALVPSSVQPRRQFDDTALQALASSIKAQGIIQPLLVRPAKMQGQYEIIGGERRWRAAKIAGLTHVPAIVRELDDGKALEVALVENIQRADLNPLEESMGYQRLVEEFNYTHEDMARVTGKSRSHITNLLRLLALPDKIKECVNKGLLSMGHARALLSLGEDPELQLRAANKVIKNQLSVRETEDLVRNLVRPNQPARGRRPSDPKISALEQLMQERVGLKVAIRQKDTKGGGSVRIFFDNLDELSSLLKRLSSQQQLLAAAAQELAQQSSKIDI
ncbi:MAG: ParB/RepB/Spo0J family partition protein [Proteobacteria bacterium]|nr:ParB/RepB/Spo0J family partition protein [Pseudomonadota bacterium]NBX86725.1 ParB/RepB/Spo0J family partition protein [Pseudomonadota bacterium]